MNEDLDLFMRNTTDVLNSFCMLSDMMICPSSDQGMRLSVKKSIVVRLSQLKYRYSRSVRVI